MLTIQPIQFGDFPIVDSTSAFILQESVDKLEIEKAELVKTFLEREHQIIKEKDEFTLQMTLLMMKKTEGYQDILEQYKVLESVNTSLRQENEDLKSAALIHSHTYDEFKIQHENVCANYQRIITELSKLQPIVERVVEVERIVETVPEIKTKMVSIGVGCSIENDEINATIKKSGQIIEALNKSIENERVTGSKLKADIEEEKAISYGLRETIADKIDMANRERSLRIDFEYLTNTMRMYLEIEMTKLSSEININGFSGFAAAAFNMYKGYCNGSTLEKMLEKAVQERTSTPYISENTSTKVDLNETSNKIKSNKKPSNKKTLNKKS